MISIFVDEKPTTSQDCPFNIIDAYPSICKLMLNHEDEYNDIRSAAKCTCVLDRGMTIPCPFLRKLKSY